MERLSARAAQPRAILIAAGIAAALFAWMTPAQAAGLRLIEIPAEPGGPALKAAVWSPCAAPPQETKLGPFTLAAVIDCPVTGEKLPLIVVSHGYGGTYLGHHDTAEALADAGFIVVALNHPDDTASNKAKSQDFTALLTRPTDVRRLISHMLGASPLSPNIDPQRIGFFGFSRGGYTGLVLAGGNPDFSRLGFVCRYLTRTLCGLFSGGAAPANALVHDPRIKAFVIADPLSGAFGTRESLKDVTAPVQLWGSQRGGDGVAPEDVAAVARDLPAPPDFHKVPGSGHFAFLSPCPEQLAVSAPEICVDSPGFDRAMFHKELNAQVVGYFQRHL